MAPYPYLPGHYINQCSFIANDKLFHTPNNFVNPLVTRSHWRYNQMLFKISAVATFQTEIYILLDQFPRSWLILMNKHLGSQINSSKIQNSQRKFFNSQSVILISICFLGRCNKYHSYDMTLLVVAKNNGYCSLALSHPYNSIFDENNMNENKSFVLQFKFHWNIYIPDGPIDNNQH